MQIVIASLLSSFLHDTISSTKVYRTPQQTIRNLYEENVVKRPLLG
ncbi:hypothetical protein [Paraburkholderia sp. BL6665CI2N2]|nr:hypothetical protein [Paraburkholderia sp. BL6665CI2N2]